MEHIVDILKFIHLSSISVWTGTLVFFSFFAAPSIFKVLPRETAGDVVGDIFPKYWAVGYVSGILGLASLLALSYIGGEMPAARITLFAFMTVVTLYSGLFVGTKARGVKRELRLAQDAADKEGLRAEFRKLHALSSILNLVVMATGFVVIFLTARMLRM